MYKKNYTAPELEALSLQVEAGIAISGAEINWGYPGEDPYVNDYGEF